MIKLITLYENHEERNQYIAIFLKDETFYELNIWDRTGYVVTGMLYGTNREGKPYVHDVRETATGFDIGYRKDTDLMLFDNEEAAAAYFWLFIRDPDLGIMEDEL